MARAKKEEEKRRKEEEKNKLQKKIENIFNSTYNIKEWIEK